MSGLNRYLQPIQRPTYALWIAAAILSCLAVYSIKQSTVLGEELLTMRNRTEYLRRPVGNQEAPTQAQLDTKQHWISLESERKFQWYPLFLAIEQASADGVDLLEFKPDKVSGQLTLLGDARDMAALVAYLERLEKQPAIMGTYLARQKNILREGQGAISFEIRARVRN